MPESSFLMESVRFPSKFLLSPDFIASFFLSERA